MNRRTALKSLVPVASVPLFGLATGCLGDSSEDVGRSTTADTTGPTRTTEPDDSPSRRVEWASMGLESVAFESLARDDVRVTATVEIRNPTEYRVPVNGVNYDVRWKPDDCDGRCGDDRGFVTFARGEVRGCDFVELLGEDRTYPEFVREEGLPCPDEKTPAFVVKPNDVTEITAVAEPQTDIQTEVANRLVGTSDTLYVRVNGEAKLWNEKVDIDFETETGLEPP